MKKLFNLILVLAFFSHSVLMGDQITWSTPSAPFSTSGVDASSPQTVIDTSGNATAIWLESGVVMASSLPFGGSWSAPVAISGSSSSLPSLGIDGSGNVTALWLQSGIVTAATHPFGGSWSATTAVSSATAATPQLAVDTAGNAVAIWGRSSNIEASIKPAAGSWGAVAIVNSTPTSDTTDNPQVSISSNGTIIAVWHEFIASSSSHSIFSAEATISGLTWNTPINVIPLTTSFIQNYPQVVIDGSGNATAIWFRYTVVGTEYESVTLASSTLPSAATAWSLPQFISNPHHRNPATLTLALDVDESGNVATLWNPSLDGSTFNINTAAMQSGSSWTIFTPIIALDLYALSADMAIDTQGNAVSVFMTNNGGTGASIASSESDLGSPVPNVWTPMQIFSTGFKNGYPSVARSLNGNTVYAVTVWVYNDGTNNRIVASTGSATLLGPPSNVTVVQNSTNFGAFTDYYNTISWTLSTDPNVVGYAIYRNGVLYTQTSSTATQIIDHNQIQNGSITYGVASYDRQFLQSVIVTKSFP